MLIPHLSRHLIAVSPAICGIIGTGCPGRHAVHKFLYAVGGVVALLILIGLFLPRTVQVAVTETIAAPPATVFAQLNDFRRVRLWSPLAAAEPGATFVFSGPARGVGAGMAWTGGTIGVGSQIITASEPYARVATVINPEGPGTATSSFDLIAGDGGTRITWRFEIDNGYNVVARYFGPIFAGIVAREYRSGLRNLAALAESLPGADFGSIEIEHGVVEAVEIAYRTIASAPNSIAVGEALGAAYSEILRFMTRHELSRAGAPLSIGRTLAGTELIIDAAIPVAGAGENTPRNGPAVRLGYSYAGPAVRSTHRGSYAGLPETHEKIAAYLAAHGIARAGPAWEVYVSDPSLVPESELETHVYVAIEEAPEAAPATLP